MPISLRAALGALALVSAGLPAAASACSVVSSYRVPTNLELVERSDVILLGVVESEAPGEDEHMGDVIVRPVALLKGESLPAEVRIWGQIPDHPRAVVHVSNPRELYRSNEGALTGGCVRYLFRRDMMLLLFLQRGEDGRLHLASFPFARSAEDVPSAEAPWVKAVRLYVEIAALPEGERRAALIARRDALRAASGDADAALIAEDIERQLRQRQIANHD